MSTKPSTTNSQNKKGLINFLVWIAIALLIRWQIVEPRWIPSGSMLPTLQLQDRILIEKVRPRISKLQNQDLPKGSMVVFHPPSTLLEAGYDPKAALIKRIIGLPGDQIKVSNGQLYVNEVKVIETWREEPIKYDLPSIIIPENQVWVLGDNRNNSLDSHLWGPLPKEKVIGTAIWRYWPLQRFGPIRFPTPTNS